MLLHLDFATDDLDAAVDHALEAGASGADVQPSDDESRAIRSATRSVSSRRVTGDERGRRGRPQRR